jgi:type II secretory pathway component GspD/PulD (secretin)
MTARQSTVCCLALAIAVFCAQLVAQDAAETTDATNEERQQERVFNVEHAPIDSVANTLKEMFESDGNKWSLMVTGKRLRVIGTQEQLRAAEDLIAKLDSIAKTERKERVFTLKRPVNARDAVLRFEELLGDEEKWSVNIANDQIRFFGTEQQIEAASDLIATLNEEVAASAASTDPNTNDASTNLHVFRTDRIDADSARRVLTTLLEDSKDFRAEVSPTADHLLVSGTAEDMEKVDSILSTLSEMEPSGHGEEIRSFDLVGADPVAVVQLLEKLLRGEGDVRIDATSNQLFFRGTRQQASLVESVLKQLLQKARQVKVFHLKNSDAMALAPMLKELLAGEGLSFGVDARTNSIVATGTEDALNVAQALLLTLDSEDTAARKDQSILPSTELPPTKTEEFASGPKAPGDGDFGESEGEYASSERDAATGAAIYRWAEASGGHSDEELRKMKTDLQAAVERAFAARQEAQSAEVDQLRQQLNKIETQVRQREAIKGQIIERRVEDLLANVDTSWWPQTPAASADGTVTQVRQSPESVDLDEAVGGLLGKVQIEYIDGLDIIVLRGKEGDVQAVQEVIKKIEQKTTDTQPQGSPVDESTTRP